MNGTIENDLLVGTELADVIDGMGGDDILFGAEDNDTIEGGEGADFLLGEEGDDFLNGGVGDDTLNGDSGEDTLNGNEGNDSLNGGEGSDFITGGQGDDNLFGGFDFSFPESAGNDTLSGGLGNDLLDGGANDDVLDGGAGNDSLFGGASVLASNGSVVLGNDTLIPGTGVDFINPGAGDNVILIHADVNATLPFSGLNTILFGFESGRSVIDLQDSSIGVTENFEPISLLIEPRAENIEFSRSPSGDLVFTNVFNANTLTISHRLEVNPDNLQIEFGINSIDVDVAALLELASIEPSSLSEVIRVNLESGTEGDDNIVGVESVNIIDAGSGNDTVSGGSRNDELNGGDGNDLINAGAGNDTIAGGLGSDTINGGDGDDLISPDRILFSANDDSVESGIDNINVIDGGAGNDTIDIVDSVLNPRSNHQILFGRGSGNDLVIIDEFGVNPEDLDLVSLVFTSGLRPEDVELDIDSLQDIIFRIIDTGETLTLDGDFGLFPEIITISFEAGGFIDVSTLDVTTINQQTEGNQTINLSELLPSTTNSIQGTEGNDNLLGTVGNDLIFSGGLSQGVESIRSNGGSDTLVLDGDDAFTADSADNSNGHFRIRDFVIDDVATNTNADVLDIGAFLLGANLDASTIGNYLHVVSGTFGPNRSSIFVDREGQFTDQDRINLTNGGSTGGNGSDLFLEFQGQAANNHLAELTGFADNTVEQFQALIDLGFLDLSNANNVAIERPVEDLLAPIFIQGSENADNLLGTTRNDLFLSEGLSEGVESIRGNGGSDTLVLTADDTVANDIADNSNAHFRIRDFIIDDVTTNSEADVLDISDLLNGFNISNENLGDHLHIVSGTFNSNTSSIFIDRDGEFNDEERAALTADPASGGQGADLFLEFQGQAGTNNLEDITGFADNSFDQLQSLIDLGFLDVV